MKNHIILAILICVGATSYGNYKQIKNEKLRYAFILNSSSTFEGYYDDGSDDKFHYFESKWQFQIDKLFKIPVEKFKIEDKYKFNFNSKALRIDLFKENNELFGGNEFYTLYVVKNN